MFRVSVVEHQPSESAMFENDGRSIHADQAPYLRYTGPQEVSRELRLLDGILRGIHIDGRVNRHEVRGLDDWMKRNRCFETRHPFSEVFGVLESALADELLTDEETDDILWLCEKFIEENGFYKAITADIQRLHGILAGVAADGRILSEELIGLRCWLEQHDHLKRCWPYDEIESLISDVLKDGRIDVNEHETLLRFFAEFTPSGDHRSVDIPENWGKSTIQGICAVCPEIEFRANVFCFTGSSTRKTRLEIATLIEAAQGRFSKNVTQTVNYLVIGAAGNPCWAFSCYGRKVEQAVQLRKSGHPIVLVHEFDFWDAAMDTGLAIG